MSSAIQMLRPCVATIRSLSRGWIQDVVRAHGRVIVHEPLPGLPPSSEMNSPNSVPTNSRSLFFGSSRIDLHVAVGGQVARDALEGLAVVARDEDVRMQVVAAMSVDRDVGRARRRSATRRCARSSTRWFARQARHVLADFGERDPPSRLTCRLPSSVPAQTTPGITGDSETAMIVLYDDDAVVLRQLRLVARRRPSSSTCCDRPAW